MRVIAIYAATPQAVPTTHRPAITFALGLNLKRRQYHLITISAYVLYSILLYRGIVGILQYNTGVYLPISHPEVSIPRTEALAFTRPPLLPAVEARIL